jgi:hypothetical protein
VRFGQDRIDPEELIGPGHIPDRSLDVTRREKCVGQSGPHQEVLGIELDGPLELGDGCIEVTAPIEPASL